MNQIIQSQSSTIGLGFHHLGMLRNKLNISRNLYCDSINVGSKISYDADT